MSQSAYKLRLFIAANTLNHGIGFLKLRQRLGYTHKDDFDRGIPRIRREIESAFEELQKAEVISSYSRNAAKDIYTWELTTKYILRTKTKLMGTTNRRMGTTNREKGTTNRKAPSILPTNGE